MDKITSPELRKKIISQSHRVPVLSIIGFVVAVLGIIIAAAAYATVFDPLGTYFPNYNWATVKFFLQLLLIVVSIVQVLGVITAFFATKYYDTPRMCGNCLKSCRKCTGNLTQTIVVILAFLALVLTVVLFCFASLLRAGQFALSNACENISNNGNSNSVCLTLATFGGKNIHCGQEFTDFCEYWTSDVNINSLLAGASFLLLSNFILIACSVANYMRYKHNIVADVVKEALKTKGSDTDGLRAPDQKQPEPEPEQDKQDDAKSEYSGKW